MHQRLEKIKKANELALHDIKNFDYKGFISFVNSIFERAVSEESKNLALDILNFQDPDGKTLIHHIVENHNTGHRTGLWAMVELSFKGADLNIQDKQGNTALHSCANFYKKLMSEYTHFTVLFDDWLRQPLIEDKDWITTPKHEREMFAFMADIGGMLWCGANPEIANNKGEKIFPLMANIAKLMPAGSVKPNICAESCKRAFIEFFKREIYNFKSYDADGIRYSWAPNVKKWVEELEANAGPEIKSAKFALEPPGKHVAKVTAQPEQQSSGCTLF
ncbi:MAG: hypothetical protein K0R73_1467 [Candidatus Midichloriaceae bacterium]|jgi:hypothetical protein|nr:hypothetical protein [Candidatus Midichloriaceae bacterium]